MRLSQQEIVTILAALDAWKDELLEGMEWIRNVHDFGRYTPLTREEVDELRDRLKSDHEASFAETLTDWTLDVPTFLGEQNFRREMAFTSPDFGPPYVTIDINREDGLRIVLGLDGCDKDAWPDVRFERRPKGWALLMHLNADEEFATLYILDDARTFLLPNRYIASPIEIVDSIPIEVDNP